MSKFDKSQTFYILYGGRPRGGKRNAQSIFEQLKEQYNIDMDAWTKEWTPQADHGNVADDKVTFRTTKGEGFQESQFRGTALLCGRCGDLIAYHTFHRCKP